MAVHCWKSRFISVDVYDRDKGKERKRYKTRERWIYREKKRHLDNKKTKRQRGEKILWATNHGSIL